MNGANIISNLVEKIGIPAAKMISDGLEIKVSDPNTKSSKNETKSSEKANDTIFQVVTPAKDGNYITFPSGQKQLDSTLKARPNSQDKIYQIH